MAERVVTRFGSIDPPLFTGCEDAMGVASMLAEAVTRFFHDENVAVDDVSVHDEGTPLVNVRLRNGAAFTLSIERSAWPYSGTRIEDEVAW